MNSQSTLASYLSSSSPSATPRDPSRSVIDTSSSLTSISRATYGDNPRAISEYYDGVDFDVVRGEFGPTDEGLGIGKSWIWQYGWRCESLVDQSKHFLCKQCYNTRRLLRPFRVERGTRAAIDHLLKVHQIDKEGHINKKRKLEPTEKTFAGAIDKYYSSFDPHEFRCLLLAWIIQSNEAFAALESQPLRNLLCYLQPTLDRRGYLPTSRTVRAWIRTGYTSGIPLVHQLLDSARSKIHLSFDIWSSRKMISFNGIHAHFCDANGQYKSVLIALPRQSGHHTGPNIAATLLETLSAFGITSDRVGYFVTDNASNNGTCLQDLALSLDFDYNERRLRCAGHLVNRVALGILWGKSKSSLEPEEGEEVTTKEQDNAALAELQRWRKRGPLGKLHNIIIWITRSPLNRERLHAKQAEFGLPFHELMRGQSTRWNSDFYSFKRAIEQKPAISSMVDEEVDEWSRTMREFEASKKPASQAPSQPQIVDDWLSSDDWHTVAEMMRILEPLEEATKRLQGFGDGASHGSIWQVIPCMEALLAHFEQLREHYNIHPPSETLNVTLGETQDTTQRPVTSLPKNSQISGKYGDTLDISEEASGRCVTRSGKGKRGGKKQSDSRVDESQYSQATSQPPFDIMEESDPRRDHHILCTNLNLGWAKLHKYYTLTDCSAAYVAALVLHPRYTWSYLRKKWSKRRAWITQAEQRIQRLWASYASLNVPPVQHEGPLRTTDISTLLWDESGGEDDETTYKEDEYTRWCRQPQEKRIYQPLAYWTSDSIQRQYPRLARLALDIFTIPAMSDDPERTFSSASLMVTSHRGSLDTASISETQCLKNWIRGNVVSPSVFMHQIEAEAEAATTVEEAAMIMAAAEVIAID